jgi:hypothetical protein
MSYTSFSMFKLFRSITNVKLQNLQLEQDSLSRRLEACLEFQADQEKMIRDLKIEVATLKKSQEMIATHETRTSSFVEYFARQSRSKSAPPFPLFISHDIWTPKKPFVSYANMNN